MLFVLFVILLLVACTVAYAEECDHVYGNNPRDYSYTEYVSIGSSGHQKNTYQMMYCELCNEGPRRVRQSTVTEQHSLVSDDYHNGDQENHVYRTYCVHCDYQNVYLGDCDCPPTIWRKKQ